MCTLAVYRGVSRLWPLIVAANRDEFFGRPAAAPAPFPDRPSVVAGRDLQAGGTWLGCRIDGAGRIAGILNRRPDGDRPASGPGELSRGQLCLDALAAPSIDSLLETLDARQAPRYGGFNLFVAEAGRAVVVDNGAGVRSIELAPGLSVLTNLDVNDPRCPRLASATTLFTRLLPRVEAEEEPESLVPAFAAVLGDHSGSAYAGAPVIAGESEDDSPFSRLCVHTEKYGTRSSSVIFMGAGGRARYFHADGAPCTTTFREIRW